MNKSSSMRLESFYNMVSDGHHVLETEVATAQNITEFQWLYTALAKMSEYNNDIISVCPSISIRYFWFDRNIEHFPRLNPSDVRNVHVLLDMQKTVEELENIKCIFASKQIIVDYFKHRNFKHVIITKVNPVEGLVKFYFEK